MINRVYKRCNMTLVHTDIYSNNIYWTECSINFYIESITSSISL